MDDQTLRSTLPAYANRIITCIEKWPFPTKRHRRAHALRLVSVRDPSAMEKLSRNGLPAELDNVRNVAGYFMASLERTKIAVVLVTKEGSFNKYTFLLLGFMFSFKKHFFLALYERESKKQTLLTSLPRCFHQKFLHLQRERERESVTMRRASTTTALAAARRALLSAWKSSRASKNSSSLGDTKLVLASCCFCSSFSSSPSSFQQTLHEKVFEDASSSSFGGGNQKRATDAIHRSEESRPLRRQLEQSVS